MKTIQNSEPQFPLRLIYDDGGSEIVETHEALLDQVDSIDTTIECDHVWVRDDLGRTVRLRMISGRIEVMEVAPS